jgi:hypothetical protein
LCTSLIWGVYGSYTVTKLSGVFVRFSCAASFTAHLMLSHRRKLICIEQAALKDSAEVVPGLSAMQIRYARSLLLSGTKERTARDREQFQHPQ